MVLVSQWFLKHGMKVQMIKKISIRKMAEWDVPAFLFHGNTNLTTPMDESSFLRHPESRQEVSSAWCSTEMRKDSFQRVNRKASLSSCHSCQQNTSSAEKNPFSLKVLSRQKERESLSVDSDIRLCPWTSSGSPPRVPDNWPVQSFWPM